MDEHSQLTDNNLPAGDRKAPFLDTVTGRFAVVAMVALILVGAVALTVVLRDRDDASARSSAPQFEGDFEVTGAEVVSIEPSEISGSCPAEAFFSAEIQTTGAEGTFVYRWIFDDAGPTAPEMASLPPGVASITVNLERAMGGAEDKFRNMSEQVMLQIVEQNGEPGSLESDKRTFNIACS